jgi:hypothetical protein
MILNGRTRGKPQRTVRFFGVFAAYGNPPFLL